MPPHFEAVRLIWINYFTVLVHGNNDFANASVAFSSVLLNYMYAIITATRVELAFHLQAAGASVDANHKLFRVLRPKLWEVLVACIYLPSAHVAMCSVNYADGYAYIRVRHQMIFREEISADLT